MIKNVAKLALKYKTQLKVTGMSVVFAGIWSKKQSLGCPERDVNVLVMHSMVTEMFQC